MFMKNVELTSISIINTAFVDTEFNDYTFKHVIAINSGIYGSVMKNGQHVQNVFTESQLDVKFENVTFVQSAFIRVSFKENQLNGVTFNECNFNDIDFSKAILTNVVFKDCTFKSIGFKGATLKNVQINIDQD